jgi:serine phosphatase RsbU (regulator of sigma subunit)
MASQLQSAAAAAATALVPRPVHLPQFEGLDLKARYNSDRCGGDFFDAVVTGCRVLFLLTDIAGKRAETFPIIVEVQSLFRAKALELFGTPDANESEGIAWLARDVNRSLIATAQSARFATAFLGCFNLTFGILTYHNAGRLCAVFRDRSKARVLDSGGIPMGLFTHSTYEPVVLAFEPGAKLLLVTKGITESSRGAAAFGVERVQRILDNSDSASVICDNILREAHAFSNHPWSRVYDFLHPGKQQCRDDMTAVALVRC